MVYLIFVDLLLGCFPKNNYKTDKPSKSYKLLAEKS